MLVRGSMKVGWGNRRGGGEAGTQAQAAVPIPIQVLGVDIEMSRLKLFKEELKDLGSNVGIQGIRYVSESGKGPVYR